MARPLLVCSIAATVTLGGAVAPTAVAVGPRLSQLISPDDLLPDLLVEPLADFRVQIVDGRRVLRFTVGIANLGDGPLELAATRSSTSQPDLSVVQHIYQPNGSYEPVPSGAVLRFSADNRHRWSLVDTAQYAVKVPGSINPIVTHSLDLCLTDETRLIGTAETRGYGCLDGRPNSRSVTEGLAVGWSSRFRSYQHHQWVDLTGLPLPGQYCVAATADPGWLLSEKSRDNNAASTLVDVTSNSATAVEANCWH